MNRSKYVNNSPRKRWLGEGFSAFHVSKIRKGSDVLETVKKNLDDLGKYLGADRELTEIEPYIDPKRPYELIFKANYYILR